MFGGVTEVTIHGLLRHVWSCWVEILDSLDKWDDSLDNLEDVVALEGGYGVCDLDAAVENIFF